MSEQSNIARRRRAAREEGSPNYSGRRDEILQAGARVFKQRGFRGTTLNHVAEALGTDRASLYYYIGSKEELFQEIVSDAVHLNLAAATEIRGSEGTAPEKLRRLVEGLMQSYADYYPVLYVLIQENLSHVAAERSQWARKMRRVNRDYERVVIEIVEAGQGEGTLRADAPAWMIAYGIIGMVGWSNRWFNPNASPVSALDIGSTFADILLDGVTAERSDGSGDGRA